MNAHELHALALAALNRLDLMQREATPGPWEDVPGGNPANGPDHMRVAPPGWSGGSESLAVLDYDSQGGADAALIAAARNLLPALLTEAREVLAAHAPHSYVGCVAGCFRTWGHWPCAYASRYHRVLAATDPELAAALNERTTL